MWAWQNRLQLPCSTWQPVTRRRLRWAREELLRHYLVCFSFSLPPPPPSPSLTPSFSPPSLTLPSFLPPPLPPPSLPHLLWIPLVLYLLLVITALVLQNPSQSSLLPLSLGALYTLTTHSPHNQQRLLNMQSIEQLSAMLSRDQLGENERGTLSALLEILHASRSRRQASKR